MEQRLHKLKKIYIFCAIIIFLFSLGVGFVLGYKIKPVQVVTSKSLRENTDKYTFIHPLLVVNRADSTQPSPEYADLAKKVKEYIADRKSNSDLDTASIYFIDYGKPGSFSLNEDGRYSPASLLKVVIMVGYFKEADESSGVLDQEFVYAPDVARSLEAIPFESPTKLKIGSSYNVVDLIGKMIIDSDNGAMNLLLAHIDNTYLTQVYKDLGLGFPKGNTTYTISVKEYSLFFRILYNSTYLSRQSSERALLILSKVAFKDGISKGVPEGITISHKFGEHINGQKDQIDSIEFHDCGYIYNPGGPYFLCVMTKGKDLDSLEQTVSGISKIIYDDVSAP